MEHSMQLNKSILKKRTFSDSGIVEYTDGPSYKKSKIDNNVTIIDFLPNDMIFYGIGNYLDIGDVIKLLKLNKTIYKLINDNNFWAKRFINDYGVHDSIKFNKNEWRMFYIFTYKYLQMVPDNNDKLTYAIYNNHTSLACKIIYNYEFKPFSIRELLKIIIEYSDLQFIECVIKQMKQWYPLQIQDNLNYGLSYAIYMNKPVICNLFIKYKAVIKSKDNALQYLYMVSKKGYQTINILLLENNALVE